MIHYGILTDEDALMESFMPVEIKHRDEAVRIIERTLSPLLQGKTANNILITGPPGSGKTLAIRWLAKERFAGKLLYVNCWNKRTQHKILEEILLQMGFVIHGRESTEELASKLEKTKRRLVVCLDESDQIRDKAILYTLARGGFGIMLIANQPFMSTDLDSRIKSGLLLNEVRFRPYSQDELIGILHERVNYAFKPSSVSPELLKRISEMASGDARAGLLMLKAAAKNAEAKDYPAVTGDDVDRAIEGSKRIRLSYLLKKLNDHQRIIYDIIRKNRRISSGKLYREYTKLADKPVVDRAYRSYMRGLIDLGLVKEEGIGRWKKFEVAAP